MPSRLLDKPPSHPLDTHIPLISHISYYAGYETPPQLQVLPAHTQTSMLSPFPLSINGLESSLSFWGYLGIFGVPGSPHNELKQTAMKPILYKILLIKMFVYLLLYFYSVLYKINISIWTSNNLITVLRNDPVCVHECVCERLHVWSQDFGWESAPATHETIAGGANQRANYRISFPLQLLSAVSLFYSMRAFIVSMGERSTVVIRAPLWQGVYQGEGPGEARTVHCVTAYTHFTRDEIL